ncbi:hypothetical protein HK102_009429, partial [Quaeritorhiza haematococci]
MKAIEFEALVARETLYIMQERSEADKRVHKVGFTKNANGSGKRAKSFETSHASGVDIPYERKVFNAPLVERDVHSVLQRYRQKLGEFFTCDLNHTKNVMDFAAAVSDTLHGCHEPISRQGMADKLIEAIEHEVKNGREDASAMPDSQDHIKLALDQGFLYTGDATTWVKQKSVWIYYQRYCDKRHLLLISRQDFYDKLKERMTGFKS